MSDDAPREVSARKKPPVVLSAAKSANGTARRHNTATKVAAPPKGQDPRFNPLVYHGSAVKQNVEKQYSFLSEVALQDQKKREARMRALRCEMNLREKERNGANNEMYGGGENDDDDDNDDDDIDQAALDELEEDDRIRIGLMRDRDLEAEFLQLKKESNSFKMLRGEQRAGDKKADTKRKWAREQFAAVRAGKQRQPFYMKEKQLRVEKDKEQLRNAAKAGPAAKNAFMEKRLKKTFGMRHMKK